MLNAHPGASDDDFGEATAVTQEPDETAALPFAAPYLAAHLAPARIDERGLLALARRAREQAQDRADGTSESPRPGRSAVGALVQLLARERADYMIVPRPRRSA